MAYIKKKTVQNTSTYPWKDGDFIEAQYLNNIEDGIAAAAQASGALAEMKARFPWESVGKNQAAFEWENGAITADGSETDGGGKCARSVNSIPVTAGEAYTLSVGAQTWDTLQNIYVNWYDDTGAWRTRTALYSAQVPRVLTPDANLGIVSCRVSTYTAMAGTELAARIPVQLQIEAGREATAYESPGMVLSASAVADVPQLRTDVDAVQASLPPMQAEIEALKPKSTNLLSLEASDWTPINSASQISSSDGAMTVAAASAGTYRGATQAIDVTGINAVIVTYGATAGTGTPWIRIGHLNDGAVAWDSSVARPKAPGHAQFDVSAYDTVVLGIYASDNTTGEAGAYVTYYGLAVEDAAEAIIYRRETANLHSYYTDTEYIDTKAARINQLAQACAADGDAFIFLTDPHWTLNQKQSVPLIEYLARVCNIPRMFIGGDVTDGNIPTTMEAVNAYRGVFGGDVHCVVGNHEYFNNITGDQLYYALDMPNANQPGNRDRHYYYVDNPQQKIRYIVLAAYDVMTGSASAASNGYEAEQVAWLAHTALDLAAGWTAIVFTHRLYNIDMSTDALSNLSVDNAVIAALDGYAGPGTIAAVIAGHTHRDRITHTPGGIPVVITTCDKNIPWTNSAGYDDINTPRPTNTTREQAFDVCVLDKSAGKLTMVRVGCPALNGVDSAPGVEVEEREITYSGASASVTAQAAVEVTPLVSAGTPIAKITAGGTSRTVYAPDTDVIVVPVPGTNPVIVAEANHRYVCGEVTSLSFTPPASGVCDVIFTSGATATALTLPNTVKMPENFTVENFTVYEINIMDGVYGVVASWPV